MGNSCQYINYNETSNESVLLTLANAYKYHKAKPGVTVNEITLRRQRLEASKVRIINFCVRFEALYIRIY